jgi:polyisoprenoid-binding protein YceI
MLRTLCFPLLVAVLTASPAWSEPRPFVTASGKSSAAFQATFPLGDFTGTTDDVFGEVSVDPQNIPSGVSGSVTIRSASLKTGIAGRDRDLRKTLEVETHPVIRFTVLDVGASFPSLAEKVDTALTINGSLSIRGVERSITLTGRARIQEGQLWVRGEGTLALSQYGVTPPKKFFLAVGDTVRISFDSLLAPKQ